MPDQFENSGSITVTVGDLSITVQMAGTDTSEPYIVTSDRAGVKAFIDALVALSGNQSGTLTLDDGAAPAPPPNTPIPDVALPATAFRNRATTRGWNSVGSAGEDAIPAVHAAGSDALDVESLTVRRSGTAGAYTYALVLGLSGALSSALVSTGSITVSAGSGSVTLDLDDASPAGGNYQWSGSQSALASFWSALSGANLSTAGTLSFDLGLGPPPAALRASASAGSPTATALLTVPGATPDPPGRDLWLAGSDPDGIYRSTDGGSTWSARISAPSGQRTVLGVCVDPRNGDLWVAGSDPDGIYRSTDGGSTWSPRTARTVFQRHGDWRSRTAGRRRAGGPSRSGGTCNDGAAVRSDPHPHPHAGRGPNRGSRPAVRVSGE